MKQQGIGLSLRYKLLILLTALPLVTLSLYLLMATKEFENDKMAYVYDSSVAVSRSLATQVRSESEALLARTKPIVEGYEFSNMEFSVKAQEQFLTEPKLGGLILFRFREGGPAEKLGTLIKTDTEIDTLMRDEAWIASIRDRTREKGLVIQESRNSERFLAMAYRQSNEATATDLVFVTILRAEELIQAFRKNLLYSSFLMDDKGTMSLAPENIQATPVGRDVPQDFFSSILGSGRPEGTEEVLSSEGTETIVSYYETGVGSTRVASVVSKRAALKAVDILLAKSLLFFMALLSITLIISVVASTQLTSTLSELYEATQKIAQGDFNVRVESRSRDEVGGLATSFNWMAGEVSRLMSETAEKARLENELATVKTVQETLFPTAYCSFGDFKIFGHFEPASECGGDWWSYSKVNNKVFLWIGDATGHGAPAALITSAARSAAAIIEILPEMGPAKALEIMNRAIYETSKSKIMMTFFLGILDLETGKLIYANASHDPPYVIRPKKDRPLTKKDLIPLMEEVGARLGEKKDSTYQVTEFQLQAGDTLFCYTDGIIDVQNPEGEAWGERTFLKTLIKCTADGASVEEKLEGLKTEISTFRQGSALIDDVTMFMCHYEEAA